MSAKVDRAFYFNVESKNLPSYQQRQDSTNSQLRELYAVANRFGLYDAADILRNLLDNKPTSIC